MGGGIGGISPVLPLSDPLLLLPPSSVVVSGPGIGGSSVPPSVDVPVSALSPVLVPGGIIGGSDVVPSSVVGLGIGPSSATIGGWLSLAVSLASLSPSSPHAMPESPRSSAPMAGRAIFVDRTRAGPPGGGVGSIFLEAMPSTLAGRTQRCQRDEMADGHAPLLA
jgi:hypothetical protein